MAREKRVSLYPLTPDEAIPALLNTPVKTRKIKVKTRKRRRRKRNG